jgi:hypothetical protein
MRFDSAEALQKLVAEAENQFEEHQSKNVTDGNPSSSPSTIVLIPP